MTCIFCGHEIESEAQYCSACGKKQNNISTDKIANRDALVRRAMKMVKEYNRYPLMPTGDLSIEYIKNVFNYNPLFVLDDLRKSVLDMLMHESDFQYDEELLYPILEETYGKSEEAHKNRILKILIENFKSKLPNYRFSQHCYLDLRPLETEIFYYAFSIFYISRDLKNTSGMLFARHTLTAIGLIHCEKSNDLIMAVESTGKLLNLSEFSQDAAIYHKMMKMIETAIENSGDPTYINELHSMQAKEKESQEKGCYIATCVYGSYDCPQVWTLRRFRDCSLLSNTTGKLFVKMYYAVSPHLVRRLGKTYFFKKFWKVIIDYIVKHLQRNGYASTPYNDASI